MKPINHDEQNSEEFIKNKAINDIKSYKNILPYNIIVYAQQALNSEKYYPIQKLSESQQQKAIVKASTTVNRLLEIPLKAFSQEIQETIKNCHDNGLSVIIHYTRLNLNQDECGAPTFFRVENPNIKIEKQNSPTDSAEKENNSQSNGRFNNFSPVDKSDSKNEQKINSTSNDFSFITYIGIPFAVVATILFMAYKYKKLPDFLIKSLTSLLWRQA